MNKEVPSFSIKDLFENDDRYVIPVYQRNYAWTDREITQLIQDIWDYANETTSELRNDYFIGSLIVHERKEDKEVIFETIDGQQRLTTLTVLMSALHREFDLSNQIYNGLSLEFDSRASSTETIKAITADTEKLVYFNSRDYNVDVQKGYASIVSRLKKIVEEENMQVFYDYLTRHVRIVRVSVPEKTDLNHYFEIMNNRGEQLEKHEILKAKLLNVISDDKQASSCFNRIWEACSDMERYIQYGFSVAQRHRIFGQDDWSKLKVTSFDDLLQQLELEKTNEETEDEELSILQITRSKKDFERNQDEKEDAPERFSSVVNFPNFLLHVLRVHTRSDVSLDDKKLLDVFQDLLKEKKTSEEAEQFVKSFGFALLKTKFLFDHFVIKREFIREKEQWSVKRLKWYPGNKVGYVNSFDEEGIANREILMLLAMFHVSTPTMVYKHWLNATLFYLYSINGEIDQVSFKQYLEELGRAFLFDRFIVKGESLDYFDIIYKNGGKRSEAAKIPDPKIFEVLDRGTDTENFVFNFLDYILWQDQGRKESFEFTFRSSVEHYYPQNPIAEEHRIDHRVCDMFGNLCLISQSKNSKLSNLLPVGKKDFYRDSKVPIDSLKQQLMMGSERWGELEIEQHGNEMKELLLNF